jgi:hypothetical protein
MSKLCKRPYNKKQAREWFELVKSKMIQVEYPTRIVEKLIIPEEFIEDGDEDRSKFIDKDGKLWEVDRGFEMTGSGKWIINILYCTKLGKLYYD